MRDKGLICLSAGTHGSTGDVRPIIALAMALRSRGFDILVLGDGEYEESALRAGLEASEWFASSEVPQAFWLRTAAGQRALWGDRRMYWDRWIRREIWKHKQERLEAFWRRVGGRGNLRIVAAVGSIPAVRMLMTFGPQCAKIVSCPMPYQPSRQFTLDPPDLSRLDRWRATIRQRSEDPEPRRRFCEEMFHLVSASPSVFPRPADWLPNMQVTGYTPLEDDRLGWTPPAQLTEFLDKGPPPVYVGFGRHAVLFGPRGARRAHAIVEGCRRRGLRCIVQCSDLPQSLDADDLLVLHGDVSHAWLFPRCAVVIHHGGYGTLHASLAARRPMIVYPFQTDQFLWAARMGELGVGPGFTARLRGVSPDQVDRDLGFVLGSGCQERAERLGSAIAADQGLRRQVAAIESIVEHTRRGLRPLDWRMPVLDADDEPRRAGGARASRAGLSRETAAVS